MTLSQSVIESLQKSLRCPDLQVFMKPEWGSHNPQHRTLIREEIKFLMQGRCLYSSISHCHGMGLVAISSFPVGVDIEITDRVQDRVMARVSSQEEFQAAPSSASLWCAKEACFKALRPFQQPSVISQITVGAWEKIDSQTETYRLSNSSDFAAPSENRGVVLRVPEHTISFFVFPS
ncbi:4'-phosphopantetheinyl transferase superfamily protein [Bdellovibrio bacteriovorus]|uniref:4'-phosphopantetheinyl transferase family protein n=1 Tax=Bdellovibrio bacteriovorus TaxID=959 RepID=UPI0035A6FD44